MLVRTYICPDTWTAKGIWTRRTHGSPVSISRDSELGIQTVRVGIVPSGSYLEQTQSGSYQKVRIYIMPEGGSELACTICRTHRQRSPSTVIDKLIHLLNEHRKNFPNQQLIRRDERLDEMCRTYLYDQLYGTAYPTVRDYYHRFGFSPLATNSMLIVDVPKASGENPDFSSKDCQAFMTKLISEYPGLVTRPEINTAGGFFLWFDPDPFRGFRVMFAMAQGELGPFQPSNMDSPPSTACSFECVNNLEYYVHQYRKGVVFRIFVPAICQIYRVDLIGDIKGIRWSTFCNFDKSPYCYGQLTGNWSDLGIIPGETFEVNTIGKEPVPGELFKVWGWMKGTPTGDCNPVLLAYGFYTHPCLTSGTVEKIHLVELQEGQRVVVDTRETGSTPDPWVGDTRLAYRCSAEGGTIICRPSDFFRYSVGERVFIYKGGISTRTEFQSKFPQSWGDLVGSPQDSVVAGCQDPHDSSELDIYSWKQVRAIQDDLDATIIPYKCYRVE